MRLWQDLKALSREEFEEHLDKFGTKKKRAPAKKRSISPSWQPADDRPVTRIAHQLRTRLSLSDDMAVEKLSRALAGRGVPPDLIPKASVRPLEQWLTLLITQVSESKVMAVAKRLAS